jgi:predicted lipoprotein with Yx(FWY)xxD motif
MSDFKSREHKPFERAALIRIAAVLGLTAVLATIGFLAAASVGRSASDSAATVSLRQTKLGRILVNASGHTLYLFGKDKNGRSACAASCAKFWPPLLSQGKPTAGAGLRSSLLGTTRRSDGRLQVTYNRHPLYTFALDKRAGQTNGQGRLIFGAKWWAVTARGTAMIKASTTTTTTSTGTTSTVCAYPPC